MIKRIFIIFFVLFSIIILFVVSCDLTTNSNNSKDNNLPRVKRTYPIDNSTDVAVNSNITISFTKKMDNSITSFVVNDATVDGMWITEMTLYYNPPAYFNYNTTVDVVVPRGFKDKEDYLTQDDYSFSFSTKNGTSTNPEVTMTNPTNGATNVSLNSNIVITFNDIMDSSVKTIKVNGGNVDGEWISNYVLMYDPPSYLSTNTLMTVVIPTTMKNSAGINIASEYSFSFTTGDTSDVTPPTVSSTYPTNGATGVLTLPGVITITFDETMDATIANTILINGVENSGTLLLKSFSTDPQLLDSSTLYTITVGTDFADISGNHLASPYVFTFQTM